MKVLTVRPPWGWAIAHARKNVENRQRNIVGSYRGPLAIHSGLQTDRSVDELDHPMHGLVYRPCPHAGVDHNRYSCTWCMLIEPQRHAHPGHIIAVVDLVDVHSRVHAHTGHPQCNLDGLCSPWAETHALHLMLENPRPLDTPIPYRGMLGLRNLDALTTAQVLRQIGESA